MNTMQAINNVYELSSIEQVMNYHDTVAGYPTKTTWIKAINAGFFAMWPLLTAQVANKYFLESP